MTEITYTNSPGPPIHPNPIQQPSVPQPIAPKHQKEGWSSAISTILILLLAPLIAVFLTHFVFQSYEVEGPSMVPTLHDNDRLIVLKTGKTWARVTGNDFIPKRGDIVVFQKAGLYEFNREDEKQLIKRVIALPGERVVVRDGIITVYNPEYPAGFQPDKSSDYADAIVSTPGSVDIVVPSGHIFVSGDNRSNSLDSRNFGAIPTSDVVGTLVLRIFPFDGFKTY